MFYIMCGQDTFSRHQELEKIKNGLGNREMLAVNTSLLNGDQLNLGQLKDACGAVPFLFPVRLIIVEGLLDRFEPQRGSRQRANRSKSGSNSEVKEWQSLGDYIKNDMPPTTVLIFLDGRLTDKNPLFKHLVSLATLKTFPPLQGRSLGNWIRNRIIQGGGSVSPEAVDLLVGLVGGDLWSLSSEVDKLLSFSWGRLITENDVRQLTSYAREANIFALVDAILEGKRKTAQQSLYRLLEAGVPPPYILAMITRQLRLIIRAKELSQKMPRAQIQSGLGLVSDYAIDKTLKQAKIYTVGQLKRAYHMILEADVAMKTGKYDSDLTVELLVVELCKG